MLSPTNQSVAYIKKSARQASATINGRRRLGFLLGNRFIFADKTELFWLEAAPGAFKELRIWRK